MGQALQERLENTNYRLTFVLPSRGSDPEKRCELEVAAVSRVCEVLEMVKLELDAEDTAVALEFAGKELPSLFPIHIVGLQDGDTVIVVRGTEAISNNEGRTSV